MRSSATKHRDMARSILPSRARSMLAQLASVRRAARHDIARELASLTRRGRVHDWDEWDDWDEKGDRHAYPDIEIRQLVYWRRTADKLNHFERWAIEVTKHLPIEDRLGHMRAVLPRGLIGDHAMSHLRNRPELNPHHYRHRVPDLPYRGVRAARQRAEHDRLRELLVSVLDVGGHRALNMAVKAAAADEKRPRTLAGRHDVDAFLAHVLAEDQYGYLVNDRWREAVESTARAATGQHGSCRTRQATSSASSDRTDVVKNRQAVDPVRPRPAATEELPRSSPLQSWRPSGRTPSAARNAVAPLLTGRPWSLRSHRMEIPPPDGPSPKVGEDRQRGSR